MDHASPVLALLAIAALTAPAGAQTIFYPPDRAWPLCSGDVTDYCVVDGDTIRSNGKRVRLIGLDAPERQGAKCARERRLGDLAAGALSGMLSAGRVSYPASTEQDRFNRELRELSVGGKPVADRMIAAGHAVRYGNGKPDWCR